MLAIILIFGRRGIVPVVISFAIVNSWLIDLSVREALLLLFCQIAPVVLACAVVRWRLGSRWRYNFPNENMVVRIFWLGLFAPAGIKFLMYISARWFDYPISLKPETFKNFGFLTTMKVGFSYLASVFHKRPVTNLENFYINSFGKRLYSMFFEYYTENLWGRHPSEIDASWGAQRTKGLSIFGIIKDFFGRLFKVKNRKVNTSLIEEFKYPKLGPGQLWDVTAAEVEKLGGKIIKNARVTRVHKELKAAGGEEAFEITKGMRIAQLMVKPIFDSEFVEVEALDDTDRGEGGFGSSGVK